jgi:hypothetical protein
MAKRGCDSTLLAACPATSMPLPVPPSRCDGTARHNQTVGREAPPFHGGGSPGPAWWVPQCRLGFYEASTPLREQPVRCVKGKALRTVQGWDFPSVTAAACDACTLVPSPLPSSLPALSPPSSLGLGLSPSSNLANLSHSLTLTLPHPYLTLPLPAPRPPRPPPPSPNFRTRAATAGGPMTTAPPRSSRAVCGPREARRASVA